MTTSSTRKLPLRGQRIKTVAAIVLGRDPADPGEPTPGWMAKLSRLMGLSHSVVSGTLYRPRDDAFDDRLSRWLLEYSLQRLEDTQELSRIMLKLNTTPREGDAE